MPTSFASAWVFTGYITDHTYISNKMSYDLGIEVRQIPSIDLMTGDIAGGVSPLQQFYIFVLNLACLHGGKIHIDPGKIHIGYEDGKALYSNLKVWLRETMEAVDNDSEAIRIWLKVGPALTQEVPSGCVLLEPGYLFIKSETDEVELLLPH